MKKLCRLQEIQRATSGNTRKSSDYTKNLLERSPRHVLPYRIALTVGTINLSLVESFYGFTVLSASGADAATHFMIMVFLFSDSYQTVNLGIAMNKQRTYIVSLFPVHTDNTWILHFCIFPCLYSNSTIVSH